MPHRHRIPKDALRCVCDHPHEDHDAQGRCHHCGCASFQLAPLATQVPQ